MAASVRLDRKPERGAKRGGDTFHPLAVPSVYALHVCGLVSLAVLCLSVPASFFFFFVFADLAYLMISPPLFRFLTSCRREFQL